MNKRTTALLLAAVLCMNTPAIAFAAEADTAETVVQTETEQENVKTITFKGANITSRKITGIKAKTYYYVRIRTYKQIGKTKIYSLWAY